MILLITTTLCSLQGIQTEYCVKAYVVPNDCVISLSVADVSKTFKQVNTRKAAGPDGITGRFLKACADQLATVFKDIFNLTLSQSVIPTCFKLTTIVTVPKNSKVTCLTCLYDFYKAGHDTHQHNYYYVLNLPPFHGIQLLVVTILCRINVSEETPWQPG